MRPTAVLDALAPVRCAGCDRVGSALCRTCVRALGDLPQPWVPGAATAFPYAGTVRAVLHRGKFRDARSALRVLADLAAERLDPPPGAVVVPVPLAAGRLRSRGYNQALLAAVVLSGHHDLPLLHLLERVRETRPQSTLGAGARRDNLRDAFTGSPQAAGLSLWLVDDVRTTGATTDAARTALLAAGATAVEVAVLASVL